jgi:ubiquinone/menaquinone biosynthesis C-methylase UbiE
LLQQVSQLLDETLLDYAGRLTPKQKARALPLLYEGFRAEHEAGILALDKSLMLDALEFMTPLKQTDDIATYHNILTTLFIEKQEISPQQAQVFDRMVALGTLSTYEGVCGQMYYDRMGMQLSGDAAKRLLEMAAEAQRLTGRKTLDWLDIGCGNGRHVAFLSACLTNVRAYGIDPSAIALRFINNLVRNGKLAADQVQQADARQLPFADGSMDVIYWRMGLHHMPYLPGHEIGAALALKEAVRVLRPGGVVMVTSYKGTETLWAPYHQQHTAETLAEAAKPYGLVLKTQNGPMANHSDNGGVNGKDYTGRYSQDAFSSILQKVS